MLVCALQVSRDGVCVAAGAQAPLHSRVGGSAWGLATVLALGLMLLVTLWTFAPPYLIPWFSLLLGSVLPQEQMKSSSSVMMALAVV